ncbi:MAG TPA: porphobilinogen synthase [Gemmatimonadaceae bacterium]|nr:porphobilinogen synthase [Gemmatimonadaceae bacterium]
MPQFPTYRGRRLRRTESLRRLVRETTLMPSQLVLPLFVRNGKSLRRPIDAMPGVSQLSPDELLRDATAAAQDGIGGVILFGIPDSKDETGSEAWSAEGAVQNAVRALKREVPDLVVITDVCMCEYTSHGHCGILENGEVVNDATLELLARASLSHAEAGTDMIAPSDMMDGRVAAIRSALDGGGFVNTPILSYAAKFASGYYGPFREAAESAPQSGDRKGYQMDSANADEALREVMADIDEGADAVMVKPAGPYLDIITRVKEATGYPVAAYQVSGEYSMICAAANNGWIDRNRVMMESLLGIRRAGADFILTYFAVEAAKLLREEAT